MEYKFTGARIRELRKQKGMTQKELGVAISRTESSVAKYEQGLVEIPHSVLSSIATALGTTVNWLLPPDNYWLDEQGIEHVVSDDKDFLKNLLPKLSKLEPLTDEEMALKILLNSISYDIMKTRGSYFFTYESGGSEISTDDLNELLNCAQNGLKIAAKTLELKLMQETLAPFSRTETTTQSPPCPQVGTDTTPPTDGSESPPEDK